ncbi:BRO-N domain-containing protein [Trueperella pyogenes]
MSNSVIPFAYNNSEVRTITEDGQAWFVVSDVCDFFGVTNRNRVMQNIDDDERGVRKLPTPGGVQEFTVINEAGLYTLLFNLEPRRARGLSKEEVEAKYAKVKAFRRWVTHEVLPTIRRQGGYINPNADEHQLNAIVRRAQMHMELLQTARGLIDPKHLEAKARVELARGLGELPQLDPNDRPLYTQDFLKTKNLSKSRLRSVAGTFGKRVKAAYTLEHGREPGKYPLNLPNGQTRDVYAYTEKDRPLMERIWHTYYSQEVA